MPNNAEVLLELVSSDLNLLERSLTDLLIALGCDSTSCSEFSVEKLKDGRFYETFSRRSRNERIYSYFKCFKNLDLQVDNFCRLLHLHFERGIAFLYKCGFTTFTRKIFLLAYVEVVYDFYHGILKQTAQYSIHDCLYLYRFFVGIDSKLSNLNIQNVYIRDEIYDLILHTLWYAIKDAWWMYLYADEIKYFFPFLSHMRAREGREIEIRDLEHVLHNLQFVVTALNTQENSTDYNFYGSQSDDSEDDNAHESGVFGPQDASNLHGTSTLDISMEKRDIYGNIHTDCNVKQVLQDEHVTLTNVLQDEHITKVETFEASNVHPENVELENGSQNADTPSSNTLPFNAPSLNTPSVTSTLNVKLLDESISNLQMYISNMNKMGSLEFPSDHIFSHVDMEVADSSSSGTDENEHMNGSGQNSLPLNNGILVDHSTPFGAMGINSAITMDSSLPLNGSIPIHFSLSSENVKTSVESTDDSSRDVFWPNLLCKSLVGSIYVFLFESYLRAQYESLNRIFSNSHTYLYQMCTKLANLKALFGILKQVDLKWTGNSGTRLLSPTISRLKLLHNNIISAISSESARPSINYLRGLHFMDDSQLYREILYNREFLVGPNGPLALHIKTLPVHYRLQICVQTFGSIITEYVSRPLSEESAIFDSLALWDSIVSIMDISSNPEIIEDDNIQILAYYLEEIKFSGNIKLDHLARRMNTSLSIDTEHDCIEREYREYLSINELNYRTQDPVSDRQSIDSLGCNDGQGADELELLDTHAEAMDSGEVLHNGTHVSEAHSTHTHEPHSTHTYEPHSTHRTSESHGASYNVSQDNAQSEVENMLIDYIYDVLSDFVIYPERKAHLLCSNVWINGVRRKKILLFGSLLLLFRENSLLQPVGFINCGSITSILSPETLVQVHPKIELLESTPKDVYISQDASHEKNVYQGDHVPSSNEEHGPSSNGEAGTADFGVSNLCWGWRMRLELSDICVTKLLGERGQTEFVDFEFMNPEHRKIWYKRIKSAVKDVQCIKDICCNRETISWPYHTLFFDSI